jgi:SNF2 family DNA or RNA helicase
MILLTNVSRITKILTKPTILLVPFSDFSETKLKSIEFTRFIIDEFHELFDNGKNKVSINISNINAKYKWAITGTPFINSSMIHNILNFVIKNKIDNPLIAKLKAYFDIFCDMFRKNTKDNVSNELALPKINERMYLLKLSDLEQTMYNSLNTGVEKEVLIQRQMAFCINPNMYFNDNGGVIEKYHDIDMMQEQIVNMHKADFEKVFKEMIKNKYKIISIHKEVEEMVSIFDYLTFYNFVINKKFELEKVKLILTNYSKILPKNFVGLVFGTYFKDKAEINIDILDEHTITEIWKTLIDKIVIKNNVSVFSTKHFGFKNFGYTNFSDDDYLGKNKSLENKLDSIKQKMNYFEKQIKLINKKTNVMKRKHPDDDVNDYIEVAEPTEDDEITCSICLSNIDDDFTMVQCGHAYCTICLKTMLMQNPDQCPQCKFSLRNTVLFTPTQQIVLNKEMIEIIKKYGTKIAHLINICNKELSKEKAIIYCHSASLINNVVQILNENKISSISPKEGTSIMKTVKDFKKYHQTLVLSSEFNASGLNIQFATAVIILQPISGNFTRICQIENQIIGRIHRCGQSKEVKLIRLIVKDSIETDILRQNKIMDMEYSSNDKKIDYPKTEKETKEL